MSTVVPGAVRRPQFRPPVPTLTVVGMATLMAYGDGFLLTSLQGATGAIERASGPFAHWLRDSSLLLPVFALVVLGALAIARRRFGPVLRSGRHVLGAALMVAVAGSAVGLGAMAASSAWDYHLQSHQVQLTHALHASTATHVHDSAACTGACAETRQQTLALHVRAVGYAAPVVLVTNLALVGWVVAVRGGRIDARTVRETT